LIHGIGKHCLLSNDWFYLCLQLLVVQQGHLWKPSKSTRRKQTNT
jgi:hypothetical protein